MKTSRRSVLAAAGASLAVLEIAHSGAVAPLGLAQSDPDKEVAELIRQSEEANAALMRGDVDKYFALIELTDDFTLMSPFGGTPTRGQVTPEQREALGRFFKNGTLKQELVQAYRSGDLIVLAVIERAHVEVGGLPAQDWALRVTLVYRRVGTEWRLALRHADPLGNGVSVEQVAAIARGEA